MQPSGIPLQGLSSIQAQALFGDLPALLDRSTWAFIALGFLILVSGHVSRLHEAGNDGSSITYAWQRTLVVLTFMLLSFHICQWTYGSVNNIIMESGSVTPNEVTRKCVKLAMSTPELETVFSRYARNAQLAAVEGPAASVQAAAEQGGLWGYAKAYWFALGDEASELGTGARRSFEVLTDGPAMVASLVATFLKAAAIFISSSLMFLFLAVAGFAAYAMDTIRYLLLMVGGLLLPAFIAGFNTTFFSHQAHKYVAALFSVMLWPLWWMLGHVGTVGLFNAYASLLAGTSMVSSAANANFATDYNWQHIDATINGSPDALLGGGGLMAAGASASFLYLGLVALGALGLCIWILLVTVGAPMLGHKLVVVGVGASMPQPTRIANRPNAEPCSKIEARASIETGCLGSAAPGAGSVISSIQPGDRFQEKAAHEVVAASMTKASVARAASLERSVGPNDLRAGETREQAFGSCFGDYWRQTRAKQ